MAKIQSNDRFGFIHKITSTSTKSLETIVYKGISRGGSESFHFHLFVMEVPSNVVGDAFYA